MTLFHVLALTSALLAIAGCPTRNKYDRMPTVHITSPMSVAYTHGTVHIVASVDPDVELPIVFRRGDGKVIETVMPPGHSTDWDTAGVPEGTYTVVAEVAFSSETAKSPPVTIVVDRASPTVMLTPAPGATDVTLRSPIQAAFSEPVLLSQPAASTFSLSVATTMVPATITLDGANQTATITIDDLTSVALPATLSVAIASTITDRAGNVLVAPSDWSWLVPDWIKFPSIANATNPVMAIGSDLSPVVAWGAPTLKMGAHQLRVARYDLTGWNQLAVPSNANNSADGGIALLLDGQDHPIVAWKENGATGTTEIHVARWNGSAWDESVPATSPVQASPTFSAPLLRMDEVGRTIVAWRDTLGGLSLARSNGSEWENPFQSIAIGIDSTVDMLLSGTETPIVSWKDSAQVGHVSTWTGTAWSAAPNLPAVPEPFLALDSSNHPMIVDRSGMNPVIDHLVANSWEPVSAMPATTSIYARHERLTAGSDHLPVVAWADQPVGAGLGLSRWTGMNWDARAGVFVSNVIDETPQVVVDRQGSVWIGWRDATSQSFNIWMSNY